MAAYEAALAGQGKLEIGASRTIPGTIGALAASYFASPEFRTQLRSSTQSGYRGAIERLCKEHGDKRVATLQPEHVVRLLAARAAKPEAANRLRKALRALMKHAIAIGLRSDDPTRDTKAIRVKSDGYHTWTEEEIDQFERTHAVGSRARLAFALLLYTGQRRSDVTRMGRQHVRNGLLHVKQQKTGAVLTLPVHPALASIIASTPGEHMTYITTVYGHPFGMTGFGKWFRDQCDAAGLPHCTAHGLRKAAARRLAEAGCTEREIAAITGHASLREVQRYTRAADQTRLALSAMAKVKTRTSSD
jgi:integrase